MTDIVNCRRCRIRAARAEHKYCSFCLISGDVPDTPLTEAMQRGREDPCYFSHYFLRRQLHDAQADFVLDAEATVNLLATANRWGKTTVLTVRHCHKCFYKLGAEPRYFPEGEFDADAFSRLKYYTIHCAGLWDTARLVWDDFHKIYAESARLGPFIKDAPRSLPPHVTFLNGSRWLFRTTGDKGEGIDGHSFYYISVDEAGWLTNLDEMMRNVLRIRVADVRGAIDLVGTMKPGISRDFFTYARRAGIATGKKVAFDHRDGKDYLKEFGVIS